jgi:phosphoribosylanthranilate isomerase
MSEREVLVKICGVRTREGAQAAIDAGADFLGFICYPPARRYVAPAQIAAILGGLRGRSAVRAIGVFVNQPVDEVNAVAALCGFDLVQLSGDEPADMIALLDRPAIKAFRPTGGLLPHQRSGEGAWRWPMPNLFAAHLEPSGAGWGGAGVPWDWGIARSFLALPARPPVILAGGLRPENVADAIAATRPDGVDVSSGVETSGVQDGARIAAFVAAAKGALG